MSSPVDGNFDCGRLLEIKARANEHFQDDVRRVEYEAQSATIRMVVNGQTATMPEIEQPSKDRVVKLVWVDDCDDDNADDCAPTCAIEGDQIGDNCVDYELTECKQKAFEVSTDIFRTRMESPEEVAAVGLQKKLILMDRTLNDAAIEFIDDNAGTNFYDGTYNAEYTVSGDTTTIPSAAWNPDLFGYFAKAKALNRLGNMRILDSGRLFRSFWKVDMESTNPDGTANLRKMGSLGSPTFDMERMAAVLNADATYLINPNSVALFTKARFAEYGPRGHEVVGSFGRQNWSTVPSPTIPGVVYDLIFQEACDTSTGSRQLVRTWQVEARYVLALNPLGCVSGRTGILKFVCA